MIKNLKAFQAVLLAIVILSLAACGPAVTPTAAPTTAPEPTTPPAAPTDTTEPEPTTAAVVELTLGSWRTDDAEAWGKILDAFSAKNPNIKIKFDPTNPPDYNATLRTQLESGTGPDLFFVRSFATGRDLFKQGFLVSLKDLPGLNDTFSAGALAPWSSDDGDPFAVPIAAVSHGIYYNQDLFEANGIAVPTNWKELLAAAQKLKDAGVTPFANGTKDEWDINETVLMSIIPSEVGGREGRLGYLNGDRCFNDADMVASFQQVKDLKPFLPNGFEATAYADEQQLFTQGKAAMLIDGSWTIAAIKKDAPEFKWSVFPVPPPEGKDQYISFHVDAAIGLNAASKNQEAGKTFLQWLEGSEFNDLIANNVPGFFPMGNAATKITDPAAAAFLDFNSKAKGVDFRFPWDKLMDAPSGQQNAYTVMNAGAIAVLKDTKTPQQAADDLQTALAAWYEPAKNCQQ
jgi:raffinose/stachyose/melibiose transport system substrate-binding protein